MIKQTVFWDKIAPTYANKPIANPEAYAHTMARTRAYLSPTDKVLEVGCGTGSTAILLSADVAQICGTDFSPGMIAAANNRLRETHSNVSFHLETGFDQSTQYDVVLAFNLLHLIDDLPNYLNTLHDRLKPGGVFISKSGCLGRWALHWRILIGAMQLLGRAPYVSFMSPEDLGNSIRNSGFEILESGGHPEKSINHFVAARKV